MKAPPDQTLELIDVHRKRASYGLATDESTKKVPEQSPWWTDLIITVALAIAFIVVQSSFQGPFLLALTRWMAGDGQGRFGVDVLAATEATYLPGFPVLLGLSSK